jgi:hypothetical protein
MKESGAHPVMARSAPLPNASPTCLTKDPGDQVQVDMDDQGGEELGGLVSGLRSSLLDDVVAMISLGAINEYSSKSLS